MSAHSTVIRSILAITTALVVTSAGAQIREEISFVYERIVWTYAKQKIEADFRRVATEKGLKISAAEIAGAAQAAFDGGIMHTDNWEEQRMVIRGCGPTKALCFVITCNSCTAR